jgi:hypothetical protein
MDCSPCSKYCLFCNNTNTTCSACVINGTNKAYLLNNSCLTNCPAGYFNFDNLTLGPTTCESCNNSCAKCSGDLNNCSSCKSGFYLYNNTCITTCPSGYFAVNATNTCNDSSLISTKLALTMAFTDNLN